jgi:hypothetical protein
MHARVHVRLQADGWGAHPRGYGTTNVGMGCNMKWAHLPPQPLQVEILMAEHFQAERAD